MKRALLWFLTALVLSALVMPAPALAQDPPLTVHRNIVYYTPAGGDDALTRLDVYAPPDAENLPVMVFVHGGGWKRGDKSQVFLKPRFFAEAGYVFVSVGYRFVPDIEFPANAEDVGAALAWVLARIADYGGDPSRVFVMGHSAGGHLAALVATDGQFLGAHGYAPADLAGVVLLDSAGYDIARIFEISSSSAQDTYRYAFGDDPAVWSAASPITYARAGGDFPPMLIFYVRAYGPHELIATDFHAALIEAGGDAVLQLVEEDTHATLNRHFGASDHRATAITLEFLTGILSGA